MKVVHEPQSRNEAMKAEDTLADRIFEAMARVPDDTRERLTLTGLLISCRWDSFGKGC